MVTRDRFPLAWLAVEAFRRQTHQPRELVVVDDGTDRKLPDAIAALNDRTVRFIRPARSGDSLGTLRNLAVAQARGRYICQWDDDDLYDPQRLELQLAALIANQAQACLLSRWYIWWPASERLALSHVRPWEGSILCERVVMPPYPDLSLAEDSAVTTEILRSCRLAFVDLPQLYVRVIHGRNSWGPDHFEWQWARAKQRHVGDAYRAALQQLGQRLPVIDCLAALDKSKLRRGDRRTEARRKEKARRRMQPTAQAAARQSWAPRVAVRSEAGALLGHFGPSPIGLHLGLLSIELSSCVSAPARAMVPILVPGDIPVIALDHPERYDGFEPLVTTTG